MAIRAHNYKAIAARGAWTGMGYTDFVMYKCDACGSYALHDDETLRIHTQPNDLTQSSLYIKGETIKCPSCGSVNSFGEAPDEDHNKILNSPWAFALQEDHTNTSNTSSACAAEHTPIDREVQNNIPTNPKKIITLMILVAAIALALMLTYGFATVFCFIKLATAHPFETILGLGQPGITATNVYVRALAAMAALLIGLALWIVGLFFSMAVPIWLQAAVLKRFLHRQELQIVFQGTTGIFYFCKGAVFPFIGRFFERVLWRIIGEPPPSPPICPPIKTGRSNTKET